MNTMDGVRISPSFAVSEKFRTWRLNLFGYSKSNLFGLPVFALFFFGLRKSPARALRFAVVGLFLGALSVPANGRPTFGPTGGGDGHTFFEQMDPDGSAGPFGRRMAGIRRFLRREGDICLVHAVNPTTFVSDSDDWEWKFEDHKIMRRRGIFAQLRRRLFFDGDQSHLSAKFGGSEDVSYSPNATWDDWSPRADQAQPEVPTPGAVALGSIGAALVGWLRRRRTL